MVTYPSRSTPPISRSRRHDEACTLPTTNTPARVTNMLTPLTRALARQAARSLFAERQALIQPTGAVHAAASWRVSGA